MRIMMTSLLLLSVYVMEGQLDLLASPEGRVVTAILLAYLFLMMFRNTGVLLHLRRSALGIRTAFSEEQLGAEQEIALTEELRAQLNEINRLMKRQGLPAAVKMLEKHIRGKSFAQMLLTYKLLKEFADRRLLQYFASMVIGQSLESDLESS